jgi:hypothetical protein
VKIIEDSRQQRGKHENKHRYFKEQGIEVTVRKLDVGDYMEVGNDTVSVDTKFGVAEIATNINRQHKRFKNECLRARDAGIRLVVLIENLSGYTSVVDVSAWKNEICAKCKRCDPRKPGDCSNPKHKSKRKPIQGDRLHKAMQTMSDRYAVEFQFCHPRDAGKYIIEILKGER